MSDDPPARNDLLDFAFDESPPATDSRTRGLAIARWLLLVAVSCGSLAAGLSWLSKSAATASPVAEALYPAPDFRLASLDGGEIGPADYAGEVVVVELWATWCGPCRLQAKFLEQLHRELDGKGVRFLAVSSGEDEATVREYVERTPFPYPVLLDPQDTLGQRYQVIGLPTVMIIDRRGVVSFLETGLSDVARLRHALKTAGAPGTSAFGDRAVEPGG